jgi:porin
MKIILAFSAMLIATNALASDYNHTLSGDWGGQRTALAESGVDIGLVYTADVMSNLSGGVNEDTDYLGNIDFTATLDGEKLYGLQGSEIFLYVLNNHGANFNNHVGSVQGIDNIEVDESTTKLYEAWVQQHFTGGLSLLAGLYDLNSEFYVTDSSGLFINPTFGIGTDYAQSGVGGPSIFPTTSLALRARWQPTERATLLAAVLDGGAGDPGDPHGTQISFDEGEGALLSLEGSYSFDFARLALGGWYYTAKTDRLIAGTSDLDTSGNPLQEHNRGIYVMAEKELFAGATGFLRTGFANGDVNQTGFAWATGLTVGEFLASRPDALLGFAVSGAHNSGAFEDAAEFGGSSVDSEEVGFELTYSDYLLPWLRIQPDVQYTVNPGTDPTLDDSWVIGSRFEVAF